MDSEQIMTSSSFEILILGCRGLCKGTPAPDLNGTTDLHLNKCCSGGTLLLCGGDTPLSNPLFLVD